VAWFEFPLSPLTKTEGQSAKLGVVLAPTQKLTKPSVTRNIAFRRIEITPK
jgi:hypothetical protein